MEALGIVVALAAVAALVGGVIWLQRRIERQRMAAYEQYCASKGYRFVPNRSGAERPYQGVVSLFARGSSHRWRDEISGRFGGMPFTAFEYLYTVDTGRSSVTYRFAMIRWETQAVQLPRFALAPEGFFQRVGELFGAQDIDVPGDDAFSRAYVLKGADASAVRALFTPAIRQALVANPGQRIAGAGPDLFWWREMSLPPPAGFDSFLTAGDWVRELFIEN